MLYKSTIAIILCTLCASSFASTDAFIPPVFTIGKLSPGQDVSTVSSQLTGITSMVTPEGDAAPTQPTDVRLAYDDRNLYISIRCITDDASRISAKEAKRDERIFSDDCLELFLDPDHDRKTYFHLVINAAGAVFDEKDKANQPWSWDGDWTAQVDREPNAWTAFVTIPFKALGVSTPKDGTVWGANFCRHEVAHVENSCWSPIGASFHTPSRFGQIVFGGADSMLAGLERTVVASPGKHDFTQWILTGDKPVSGVRQTSLDRKIISRSELNCTRNAEQHTEFKVDVPSEGRHLVCVTVFDGAGRVVMRSPMVTNIPAHGARLDKYLKLVKSLPTPTSAASRDKTAILARMAEMESVRHSTDGDNEDWAWLGKELDMTESLISNLRYLCMDAKEVGYVLGADNSARKIMRHRFFEGTIGGPVKISVARNEYEGAQAVIIPCETFLRDVVVSISDLKGPGGHILPRDRVTLNLVEYVKTRKPIYPVDYVGWWPDPLVDLKPFDVNGNDIQPVWITVHPSEDTPAGVYKGIITFAPANAPNSDIPIEVRVWDFALPKETHLKTAFSFNELDLGSWYGKLTPEMRRDAYKFLLDHRLNVMSLYSGTAVPTKEYLPFCFENGEDFFSLIYMRKGLDKAKIKTALGEYREFLKSKGWEHLAYVYGYDEIKEPDYQDLIDGFGFTKKEFPDLPTMCTVVPNEKLDPYVDIWVPLTRNWKQEDARKYTAAGDKVWWYVCCGPLHPYANYFIDYPAIDPRILSWMNWKYEVPGVLYYAVTNWHSNRLVENLPSSRVPHDDPKVVEAMKAGKLWPEVPWNTWTYGNYNGDGQLVYPGPNGRLLSSIRMEAIRDGIEDYEMFYMLNERVKAAERDPKADRALLARAKKLLAVDESVVKSLTEYTQDPAVLLKYRQDVAETIERLR